MSNKTTRADNICGPENIPLAPHSESPTDWGTFMEGRTNLPEEGRNRLTVIEGDSGSYQICTDDGLRYDIHFTGKFSIKDWLAGYNARMAAHPGTLPAGDGGGWHTEYPPQEDEGLATSRNMGPTMRPNVDADDFLEGNAGTRDYK